MTDQHKGAAQPPEEFVKLLNQAGKGFDAAIGLRFVSASREELVAELVIGPQHHQPYGLVHGGVYASIVETMGSVGTAIYAIPEGRQAVGLENSTSFLRAARGGTLTCRAVPLFTGRRTHTWNVTITREDGKAVAVGRLRTMIVDPSQAVAGKKLDVSDSQP